MGTTYAIDLVPVDGRNRSAPRGWRALVGTEPPQGFVGFGVPVLAPCAGTVVIAHDRQADHEARRSQLTLLAYMLTQRSRLRGGALAIAGNHVVIAMDDGAFVLLAHLRQGSLAVQVGDRVAVGDAVGSCGNSGNSTEPHVHLQATDTTDWAHTKALPILFATDNGPSLPGESEIIVSGA